VVDIIFIRPVKANGAIFLHEMIHTFLDIFEILSIPGPVPQSFYSFQHHALVIGPFNLPAGSHFHGILPDGHYGGRHFFRPGLGVQ
jgi:hypothetical protein